MAITKQAYAQEAFSIGRNEYERGTHLELAYETDYDKQVMDSLYDSGLLADHEPAPLKPEPVTPVLTVEGTEVQS